MWRLLLLCCLQVVRCFEDDDIVHVSGKVGVAAAESPSYDFVLQNLSSQQRRGSKQHLHESLICSSCTTT
jgi:ribosome-binding ATPase YchF (GTP1/OBG family)